MVYSILIVEDEYLVRQGLAKLVNFTAYDMEIMGQAENGRQAWELIQKQVPDVILTDINMPQMNGIQLASLVREKYPQTHLVFLTGYDDFDYALSAVKLGVDDYLLKPFSRQDIEEMLGKIKDKLDKEGQQSQVQDLLAPKPEGNLAQTIQEHLSDSQFSLKSLAGELGFSPTYLSSLIKKELGLPFQDYLVRERVKKAKLLLLTTDLRIYEIAEQVGFEDMNYFTQRFKQIAGMTPRQYKKGEAR
ncbi:response regulator transcription factor [Falseniella ignava]